MNKCLLSLMLLVSGWVWGAEVLPHGGVVETKAEMVTLARGADSFMVPLNKLAPFEMLRAGFVANGFEESHSRLMQLNHEVINKLQYDFLKLYLEDSEAALASLASYGGDQIVDIMMMLDYLNADSNSLEIKKLNNALIDQLKDKLSSEVIQKLFQNLWMELGLNLSQIVPGESAEWSPDGSKLRVMLEDEDGRQQIQIYQVFNGRLVAMCALTQEEDEDIVWRSVVWSPDGTKLLINFSSVEYDGRYNIQVYQVANEGLVAISAVITVFQTCWSPDGSKLWVQFGEEGAEQVSVYQVVNGRFVTVDAATVPGWFASWNLDGSKLWVTFGDDGGIDQIQAYQVTNNRLIAQGVVISSNHVDWSPDESKFSMSIVNHGTDHIQLCRIVGRRLEKIGEAVPGCRAGWSPDGSKLWVEFTDHGARKIQVYRIIAEKSVTDEGLVIDAGLVPLGTPVLGDFVSWSLNGSKLFVTFKNLGVEQVQVYRVADEGLIPVGEPIAGWMAEWSSDGSKLWVKGYGAHQVQAYKVDGDRLVAIDVAISSVSASWSPDGSKLWMKSYNNSVGQIQMYQVVNDRLVAIGVVTLGIIIKWSSDGSKMFISDNAANQIIVYFDVSCASLSLDQLLKKFISDIELCQDLSLAQQMFLVHVLQEHQKTKTAYDLPVDLEIVWNSLSMELQGYLVSRRIVNTARSVVRPYAEIATDSDDEPDVAHRDKSQRR